MKKASLTFNLIFILTAIAVVLIIAAVTLLNRVEGAFAVVSVGGEVVGEYPLSCDGEYLLNGGSNILVIEGGEAYMKSADCPDKTCVKSGRIRYVGESITCLPNRINVRIVGNDGVDIVS